MHKTSALVLTLMVSLPAGAQGLAQALEQAWARHPLAAASAARETEAGARADVAAALTAGPPSMSLSSLNDRLYAHRGQREWEIEVAAPLWLPGQKAARGTEAAQAQNEVAARRQALRLQIAGEVRSAWWAVANARNTHHLAQERVHTALALQADVLRRFAAGEVARTDANLAQSEHLAAQDALADAQAALLQAEQSYHGLTGAAAPAVLATEAPVAPGGATPENHPQLAALAAAAQLARARLQVTAETRRGTPELAVRWVRERSAFGEAYANTVGVKLTVPFSSAAHARQDNAAAQAELAQADAQWALAQRKLALESENARLALDAAERQWGRAGQRLALNTDTLRLVEKTFALGEADLPTLLRARAAALEAQAALGRQQLALAAAQSQLHQALGVLP